MATRILLLLLRFMDKKLFIFKRKNAVLWAMNAYLDIGSKNYKFIFDDILMRSFLGACTCDCQTYMSCDIFCSTISACRPVNTMPEGPLYKAAKDGDVKASVAVIRVNGHLQAKQSHIHPHTHTLAHAESLTHSQTHSPTLTHPNSVTYTEIHSQTHTHSYTHTHTHTRE